MVRGYLTPALLDALGALLEEPRRGTAVYNQVLDETFCEFLGNHAARNVGNVAAWVRERYPRWARLATRVAEVRNEEKGGKE